MAQYLVGPARVYTTMQAALNAMPSNATSQHNEILLDYATYNEQIDLQSLSDGGWQIVCTIRAADPNNPPIITGTGKTGQAVRGSVIRGAAVARPVFQDLIFEDWNNVANGIFYSVYGGYWNNVLVRNSTSRVHRFCEGTSTWRMLLDYCRYQATGEVITIVNQYTSIRGCRMRPNADTSAIIGAVAGSLVHNTSIHVNLTTTVRVACQGGDVTNVAIKNLGTGGKGIDCAGTYKNVLVNGSYTTRYTGTSGGSLYTTDPLWTDSANDDFTFGASSPLVDAGFAIVGWTVDANGVIIPQGAAPDIGALEREGNVTVSSITVVDSDTIRLILSGAGVADGSWTTPGNFVITGSGGAVAVTVSASAGGGGDTYIELTTSEHTNGGSYNVAWSNLSGVTDGDDDYIGIGVAPTIDSAVRTGMTIRVTFSHDMTNNAALTALSSYTFTPYAKIVSITRINARVVDIVLGSLPGGFSLSLTVSGPSDLALNPI